MFKGCFCNIVTPFEKGGRVDYKTLKKLLNYQIQSKIDGIIFLGYTGEGVTLSEQEREEVIQFCTSHAKNKVKVIVGCDINSTDGSFLFAKKAKSLGVDGLLATIPCRSFSPKKELIYHFKEIAKAGLPIILSINKSTSFQEELISELEQISQIVAVRVCEENEAYQLKSICSLPMLAGNDQKTLEIFKVGISGCISDVANIIPHHWKIMVDLLCKKEYEKAEKIISHYKGLISCLDPRLNPLTIKYILSLIEKCGPTVRLPFIQLSDQIKQQVQNALFQTSILEAFVEKDRSLAKMGST